MRPVTFRGGLSRAGVKSDSIAAVSGALRRPRPQLTTTAAIQAKGYSKRSASMGLSCAAFRAG